jgi:diguanylate cyclase (GGDEF)-like protein
VRCAARLGRSVGLHCRVPNDAYSATEVAFLFLAVVQASFAVIWGCGAWWAGTARRAVAHWAAWSVLSASTWFVLAAKFESPPLLGVLVGLVSAITLQRGIRLFIDKQADHRIHLALLGLVVVAWLVGVRHWQAVVNFGALTWLYLQIARDLHRHARERLRFRRPILLAVPVLLGAAGYGMRALRALLAPESVLNEMAADSALNIASALAYVVLVLALHATLATLVVGRLLDELRRLSLHDALTGLLNRRAMEERLHAQLRSSRRSHEPFAVMMLDLDYFKRINDRFGHAVGDLALQHVAKLLLGALRDADKLARFGGEEFVILMPATTLAQAEPLAERLRSLLAAQPLRTDNLDVPRSVSIGVAEWLTAEDDFAQLLQRADAALFQAKVQGRNCVVMADAAATPAAA